MMKTCSKCKQEFPATTEYFHKHKSGKNGLNSWCKVCHSNMQKKHYLNNRNKILAKVKVYNNNNKDKKQEYDKKYNLIINVKNKRSAQMKEWRKNNPDKRRGYWHKRVAKQKGNGWEPYTEEQMLSKYGSICYLCNEEIDLQAPRKSGAPGWKRSLWKEHVIPVSKGGPDTLDNVRPSHGLCNLNKSNKEIYEKA